MNTTLILIIAFITVVALFAIILSSSGKSKDSEWKQKAKSKSLFINNRLNSNDVIVLKNLLIEADTLLDYCFKSQNIRGETMGERLKNAKDKFDWKTYQNIWEAHKLRNSLVHEVDVKINTGQIKHSTNALIRAVGTLLK